MHGVVNFIHCSVVQPRQPAALSVVGLRDMTQTRHAILRKLADHRASTVLLRGDPPGDVDDISSRARRTARRSRGTQRASLSARRGGSTSDLSGRQYDVDNASYEWLNHRSRRLLRRRKRFATGSEARTKQPYAASVFNISAMSFARFRRMPIRALNRGAKMGRFAHDTGEGERFRASSGVGGDLIWEIGSRLFGARNADGRSRPERFRDAAADPQIKMVELKLSQAPSRGTRRASGSQGEPGDRSSAWRSSGRGLHIRHVTLHSRRRSR